MEMQYSTAILKRNIIPKLSSYRFSTIFSRTTIPQININEVYKQDWEYVVEKGEKSLRSLGGEQKDRRDCIIH
jgi:hypothetical protein